MATTSATPGPAAAPTTTSANSQSTAATARNQLGVDYNNFLKLLTAQIGNQDPLKPMDSTQFVSQLAQLSQVEQAVQTNSNLEALKTRISAISAMSDINLMGRDVTLASDRLELSGGAAGTVYQLSGQAQAVNATITDGAGTVVRHLSGLSTQAGTRVPLNWNGRDDAGNALPDGIYHLTIDAKDAQGNAVSYDTYPTTRVEQVLFGNGTDSLRLRNGQDVPAAQLLSVS